MRIQTAAFVAATIMLSGCPKQPEPEAAPVLDVNEEVLDALEELDSQIGDFPEVEGEDAPSETGTDVKDSDVSPFSAPSVKSRDVYVPLHAPFDGEIVGC